MAYIFIYKLTFRENAWGEFSFQFLRLVYFIYIYRWIEHIDKE